MNCDCDVAIVGAGPVGLTLANLLARRGVRVNVLERQQQPYPLPRAIHFDGEVMRVFQATGLAEQILPHIYVGKGMLFQDMEGRTLVDWSRSQDIGPMGWHESYRFYQIGLENALREGLDGFPNAALQMAAQVTALEELADGLRVTLEGGDTLTARYVVGCDGASSMVRNWLGVGIEDLGFHERWLVLDLKLVRPRDDLGDHSIQYCDPDRPATYVRGIKNWRRWEMRLRADDPDPMPADQVWQRLARWISPRDATLERAAVYTFRSKIAETWQRGRVMIAGDAAHQMPPFMGQGMCAGIRDAGNLWWKLVAVLNGYDPALLSTYESERAPNVRAFIEKSVALGRLINQTAAGQVPEGKMQSIWPALGPGLGPRDGIGGTLQPQIRMPNDQLSDDVAGQGFYVCAPGSVATSLPVIKGHANAPPVILRPDGYALGPATPPLLEKAEGLASAMTLR